MLGVLFHQSKSVIAAKETVSRSSGDGKFSGPHALPQVKSRIVTLTGYTGEY